jgi:opacity protein-like surface antigen
VRPNWTTGIEVGVIYNKVKEINGAEPLSDISLYEVPLLLNVTWQLPIPGPLKFYGGGGVGGVFSVWDGVSSGSSSFTTDWTFGFQGVAGVKYALGSKWDLDGTYKYLGTTGHENFNGTFTHAFVASITCKF